MQQNMKAVWINFFDIVYDIEEQRENTLYTEPKQTNCIPFFREYILLKFFVLGGGSL
jgi:hypothetical protein